MPALSHGSVLPFLGICPKKKLSNMRFIVDDLPSRSLARHYALFPFFFIFHLSVDARFPRSQSFLAVMSLYPVLNLGISPDLHHLPDFQATHSHHRRIADYSKKEKGETMAQPSKRAVTL